MTDYFYFDQTNQKRGPVDKQQLQELVAQGIIGPNTPMETDAGHTGTAGQIPGLFATPPPQPQPVPVPPPAPKQFCTNCGNAVSEQAVACMSCGAKPTGHRKFCRHCAAALNPEQVVCVQCGAKVGSAGVSQIVGDAVAGPKSKIAAGLLGILLGGLGAHKFYLGSWGWGLIFLACSPFCGGGILYTLITFVTLGFGAILFPLLFVGSICGLIEGIIYLTMSDEAFAEKYPVETQGAFRW